MLAGIEEEELADNEGLDEHDRARCDDCQQADNVEDSDDIENYVAGTSQWSAEHDE